MFSFSEIRLAPCESFSPSIHPMCFGFPGSWSCFQLSKIEISDSAGRSRELEAKAQQLSNVYSQKKPKQHHSICNELDFIVRVGGGSVTAAGNSSREVWGGAEHSSTGRVGARKNRPAYFGFHTVIWQRSRALTSVWISQSGSSLAGLLIGLLGERSSPGVVFFSACFHLTQ